MRTYIANASTLRMRMYIHFLAGVEVFPRLLSTYVLLQGTKLMHTDKESTFFLGGRAQLAPFVGQCGMHTQCGG